MGHKLKDFVQTSPGFQYSINVKYDLNNKDKVANYIPLKQNVEVMQDIIAANYAEAKERARLIVGTYGTGKSHLSTVILSLLSKVLPLADYKELLRKIDNVSHDSAVVIEEELKKKKLLPVVITESEKSFKKSLLVELVATLKEAGLSHIMPETVFSAATRQIEEWKKSFPDAYSSFKDFLKNKSITTEILIKDLESNYNPSAYKIFEEGYSYITHGAVFQPLLRSEPKDVYLKVSEALPKDKYKGIVVLFDEFGKYLETRWERNKNLNLHSVQEFAEACDRSGDSPVQLILVTHKPIAQYALKYGQEMVNEWKKIEGRFKIIELINQPSKVYEIVSQVIVKEQRLWKSVKTKTKEVFEELLQNVLKTRLFSELDIEEFEKYVLYGAFPLHPVSVFCLPRFSQQVAQNERTIFTFLATNELNTLGDFIQKDTGEEFNLLTLDILYDYFERELKGLDPEERIFQVWLQTSGALARLDGTEINQARILKALAVIRVIGLPAILPPNQELLRLAFLGSNMNHQAFGVALQNLFNQKILFEGPSTGNLEIIQLGEIDVEKEVTMLIAKRKGLTETLNFLNKHFSPRPILAKRYNDEYTMTRYFSCFYSSCTELKGLVEKANNNVFKDGSIFYVLPKLDDNLDELIEFVGDISQGNDSKKAVFVYPQKASGENFKELETLTAKLDALSVLLDRTNEQHSYSDRLEILLWIKETKDKVNKVINSIFDLDSCILLHGGKEKMIKDKTGLTRLVSEICYQVYNKTPKFNNEMINKHDLTSPISKARHKVIDGLIRPIIKPRLGISGTGPDIAIYRTILKHTRLITEIGEDCAELTKLNELPDQGLVDCLRQLRDMFSHATDKGVSFSEVIKFLCSPPFGVRKGIIPILLAVVLHELRKEVTLLDASNSEMILAAETLEEALKRPEDYYLLKQDWSKEKALLCEKLKYLFSDYADTEGGLIGPTREVTDAFKRWFLSLPKFARDTKKLSIESKEFRRLIKQENITSSALLFEKLPGIFGEGDLTLDNIEEIFKKASRCKEELEGFLHSTLSDLQQETIKRVFGTSFNSKTLLGYSRLWYGSLEIGQKQRLYSDGTQELMDHIDSFIGENSDEFLVRIFTSISSFRPEDWNDTIAKQIPSAFEDMVREVETLKAAYNEVAAGSEIEISFLDNSGQSSKRTFVKSSLSESGELLQNVLGSFIDEYGDAITNNEKRQILLNLLEKLTR